MKSKLLITLLVIILLVVYYLFGMDYMKQRKENMVIASQIADTRQVLAQMPGNADDLEQRLAAARSSLSATQSSFPGRMNSTQVVNSILELADDYKVRAIPLVTQPWLTENIGEHAYYVFRFNIVINGSFSHLVGFIGKLENGEFETLIVENLSVTRVGEESDEENVTEGTIVINANLDLAIYTQAPPYG